MLNCTNRALRCEKSSAARSETHHSLADLQRAEEMIPRDSYQSLSREFDQAIKSSWLRTYQNI